MQIQGRHHLIGYGWEDQHLSMRLRSWPEPEQELRFSMRDRFRFSLEETRLCTGYYDFAEDRRKVCPHGAVPEKKSQCEDCLESEGFVPWLRCDGRDIPPLKPAVREYIESPHYLYLANFGDEMVKVGMASQKRKAARLDDQGPLAAIYVAKGQGIAIRQLEVEISRMGYTEFMRRSKKLRLLTEGGSQAEAQRSLQQAFDHIRAQLQDEYRPLLLEKPEPYELLPAARKARSFSELDELLPEPGKILDTEVLAASGSVVVVDDGGIRAALDLGEIVGRVLNFNPSGEVEREARQIGLF